MPKPTYDRGAARLRLGERYDAGNLASARIIATDPKYPGIMQEWAATILRGEQEREAAWRLTA